MTQEEKLGGAIIALKMIANTEPRQIYVQDNYYDYHYDDCGECRKMIMIAKEALKELGVN